MPPVGIGGGEQRLHHHLVSSLKNLTAAACPNTAGELFGIAAVPEQVRAYAKVAASLNGSDPHICEVGFNCGHSTTTFLEANPRATLVNFDLPMLRWARSARSFIKHRYGSRVKIIDGPSRKTIPEFARAHPNFRCDLVVVDGEHSYVGSLLDLVNLLQYAPCNAPVLMDDICDPQRCHAHIPRTLSNFSRYKGGSNHPSIIGTTMAWNEALRVGHVAQLKTWFNIASDRGWVLGRNQCGSDGKAKPMQPSYTLRPPPLQFEPDIFSKDIAPTYEAQYEDAAKAWGGTTESG